VKCELVEIFEGRRAGCARLEFPAPAADSF
jgi:hypothetical protein